MTTTAPAPVKLTAPRRKALEILATRTARRSNITLDSPEAPTIYWQVAAWLGQEGFASTGSDGVTLTITAAGRAALGLDPSADDDASSSPGDASPGPGAVAPAAALDDVLAAPAEYIVSLPVSALHAVAHNRELRDLDGLAESIRRVGMLQPVLVRTDPANGYEIVDGARRHAAAVLAGMVLVPCIVNNDRSDDDVELARIIANVQRDDPTPLEEAAAYDRMVSGFKMTAIDVASAVGRSESHISKRRSLLLLPADAQAALADGRINIQTALGITGLVRAEDREHLDAILDDLPAEDARGDALERARQLLDQRLADRLAIAEAARTRAAVIAELEKAGEVVLEFGHPAQVAGTHDGVEYRVCRQGEPAEAYSVDTEGRTHKLTAAALTTDRRQADPPKTTPLRGKDQGPGFVEQARQKKLADLRKAFDRRVGVMRTILAGDATRAELTDHVLRAVPLLEDSQLANPGVLCAVLAIAAVDGSWSDHTPALDRYRIDHVDDEPLEYAAAVVLATADPGPARLPGDWSDPGVVLERRHFALLEAHGYELTDEERAELNRVDDEDPDDDDPFPATDPDTGSEPDDHDDHDHDDHVHDEADVDE